MGAVVFLGDLTGASAIEYAGAIASWENPWPILEAGNSDAVVAAAAAVVVAVAAAEVDIRALACGY